MKRYYFPNTILKDDRIPFTLEITADQTVYARDKKGQIVKPDQMILKHCRQIAVNHEGFNIRIKGYDKETKQLVYDITEEQSK